MTTLPRCACGTWMVAGVRHEAGGALSVALCLACWCEEPPYAVRPAVVTKPAPPPARRCATCTASLAGRNLDSVYCSTACRWGPRRLALVCASCGSAFTRPRSWAERRAGPYCSRACIGGRRRLERAS